MKKSLYILLVLVWMFAGGVKAQPVGGFPHVTAPSYIADERGALAEWMTLHWWDNYDFAAAEQRYSPEANKRGFVEFVGALYATTPAHSFGAIERMMHRAATSEDGYWYFLEMAEMVLYDPSSPMRNDLLWEVFVRHAVGKESPLDEPSKVRYRSLLELVQRNQQGSVATDFDYTLADGSEGRLHDITAPLTVIYFYNPGCSECARTKAQIDASGYLDLLLQRGLVEVLALYPDEDVAEWRSRLYELPEEWIVAYDKGQTINRQNLYDLKAIPTLYLLDAQKRVMMKDPTVEDFIGVLEGFLR